MLRRKQPQTPRGEPEAEIDVIVIVWKIWIETANLLKKRFTDGDTSASHGRDIPRHKKPRPKRSGLHMPAGVPDAVSDSYGNSCMLEDAVRIPEDSSCYPGPLAGHAVRQHSRPSLARGVDVVVQEEQVGGCVFGRQIVHA